MVTLNRYRIIKLPSSLQVEFALPEVICADPEGQPFLEGQEFYRWIVDDNACEAATAYNYLGAVLQFLTYLWENAPPLRYTAPTAQIRTQVREYLRKKLGCVVRPHRAGNFMVKPSPTITATSARLFLTALRRYYFCAIVKGWYTDANPMEWSVRLAQDRQFKPQMPPQSGLTVPERKKGRVPDTYFCVVAEDWQPQIIDDEYLRQRLLPAFTQMRDRVIARTLFDSGARISEVLRLTLGDWRKRGGQTKAWTTNKGSHGECIKEIWWSDDTAQWIRNYIARERRRCDPSGLGLDELPDSAWLFITEAGTPYTYKAFYANWQTACQKAQIKITPHQIRHWFVTMALHMIDSLETDEVKRAAYRQALIEYMGWRNPETIRAYDHHLRKLDFAVVHAKLVKLGGPDVHVSPQPAGALNLSADFTGVSAELMHLLRRAIATAE
jgi:site-specific recombinase XerC